MKLIILFFVILVIIFFLYYYLNFYRFKKNKLNGSYIEKLNFDDALVVDVRKRDEYENGHCKNAVNLPYSVLKKNIKFLENYKEKEIIFYCTLDILSNLTKKIFIKKGYKHIKTADGFLEYNYDKRKYNNILLNDFKIRLLEKDVIALNVGDEKLLKKEIFIPVDKLYENLKNLEKFKEKTFLVFSSGYKNQNLASDILYKNGFKVYNLIENLNLNKLQLPVCNELEELLYSKKVQEEFCPK